VEFFLKTFMTFVQYSWKNPAKTLDKSIYLLSLESGNYRMQSTLVTVVITPRRVFFLRSGDRAS
jgi:hypothetical protein